MKKLLAMLGVCALATGAWAGVEAYGYQYSWNVTIMDVPSEVAFPSDIKATLQDSQGTVYFYASAADLRSDTEFGIFEHKAQEEGDYDHLINEGSFTKSKKYGSTDQYVYYKANIHVNLKQYVDFETISGLKTILNYTDADGNNVTRSYNVVGDQTSVVTNSKLNPAAAPEPTSAMLMLLGVAGLALKRKRA